MTSKYLSLLSLLIAVAAVYSFLVPKPSHAVYSNGHYRLSSSFSFEQASGASHLLETSIKRFNSLVQVDNKNIFNGETKIISKCDLQVKNVLATVELEIEALMSADVDESYHLVVDDKGTCSITSNTIYGAMFAMETFTQFLTKEADGDNNIVAVSNNYVPLEVVDAPRFSHRGLLIDTSRHYLHKATIKQFIDAMAMNKFNVLHWHLVDAQSFPFASQSAPRISQGAYQPQLVYSMADVTEITLYAAAQAVRVMVEIDVPGHAASWNAGYPEIMADCFDEYSNVNNYALNPVIDATYDVVREVLRDAVSATGSKYLHVGGDEVVYGCWEADASIARHMKREGKSSAQLMADFLARNDESMRRDLKVTPVHWEEAFFVQNLTLPPSTIFQIWTNSSQVSKITSANYEVIVSSSDYWYLDHLNVTWKYMYSYDPTVDLPEEQKKLVRGGEACAWGEYIDDDNLLQVTYPRSSAVAERLWSPKDVTDQVDALARLTVHRCRMKGRGVPAAPIQPDNCGTLYV